MINLIVTAADGAWEGKHHDFLESRVLEHTTDALRNKFMTKKGIDYRSLCGLPTVFAYEDGVSTHAHIGFVRNVRERSTSNRIRIEYEVIREIPSIKQEVLEELAWDFDISQFEYNRTHWAVKDVDLVEILVEHGLCDKRTAENYLQTENERKEEAAKAPGYLVSPSVFRIPGDNQRDNLVAVMMPFRHEFEDVYKAIKESSKKQGFECHNVNEVWENTKIIEDIFELIFYSRIVVCDFSTRNPNVFYEAGIAHTLGREVIPIVQRAEDVPFDLQQHRYIEYLNNEEGRGLLQEQLERRLQTLKKKAL